MRALKISHILVRLEYQVGNVSTHHAGDALRQTGSWMPDREIKARFIEPMLLHRTETLPEGGSWTYELKLDGFRAEAIKSGGRVHLRSRNDKDFNPKYPAIVTALAAMPEETVIDGEIVALDVRPFPVRPFP